MEAKEIKAVVQQTEKELEKEKKEKQISKVKEIVKRTLEAIETVKKDKDEAEKRLKYLKMDLDDLRIGRLDLIEERQNKDSKAKENSVIIIIKEKEVIREISSPWFIPYHITWNYPTWWYGNPYVTTNNLCLTADTTYSGGASALTYDSNSVSCGTYSNGISINCSVAKDYSAGAYDISGKVINFR